MKNYNTQSQEKTFIDKVHELPIPLAMKEDICLWFIAELREKLSQITGYPSREGVSEKEELRGRYGI